MEVVIYVFLRNDQMPRMSGKHEAVSSIPRQKKARSTACPRVHRHSYRITRLPLALAHNCMPYVTWLSYCPC